MKNTPKEWKLVERIRQLVERKNEKIVVPLGDDGFVFKNDQGQSVICQDMMVEGTHFSLDYFSAFDLGFKSLAVNLSDIAAMGGKPQFAQVSLALPQSLNEQWLEQFYQGMVSLADEFSCQIVGGDLARIKGPLVIDVSVYGSCPYPLTRKGAQIGDLLLSSGNLGLSHTGLLAFQKKQEGFENAKMKHLRPRPRLDLVDQMLKHKDSIHALMDSSDGLVNDGLRMIPEGVGLKLFTEKLPLHQETIQLCHELKQKSLDFALWGGEDFELLMAISPNQVHHFLNWNVIGEFIEFPGVFLESHSQLSEITEFKGWDHFAEGPVYI